MSLEEQIKAVAQHAANDRWGHPGGPNGECGNLKIIRIEPTGPNEWTAYYREPDTLTEEWVYVERKGDTLHAENFEISIEDEDGSNGQDKYGQAESDH